MNPTPTPAHTMGCKQYQGEGCICDITKNITPTTASWKKEFAEKFLDIYLPNELSSHHDFMWKDAKSSKGVIEYIDSLLKENTTASYKEGYEAGTMQPPNKVRKQIRSSTLREVMEYTKRRKQSGNQLALFPSRVHYNKALEDVSNFIQHKFTSEL